MDPSISISIARIPNPASGVSVAFLQVWDKQLLDHP